jgi:hypothetical protein
MKWLRLYSRKLSDAEVLALHNDYLSGVIYS